MKIIYCTSIIMIYLFQQIFNSLQELGDENIHSVSILKFDGNHSVLVHNRSSKLKNNYKELLARAPCSNRNALPYALNILFLQN